MGVGVLVGLGVDVRVAAGTAVGVDVGRGVAKDFGVGVGTGVRVGVGATNGVGIAPGYAPPGRTVGKGACPIRTLARLAPHSAEGVRARMGPIKYRKPNIGLLS